MQSVLTSGGTGTLLLTRSNVERLHRLRVEFSGKRISVALNGKVWIELDDAHMSGPGAVGMWTKADRVTVFDDFSFGAGLAPR